MNEKATESEIEKDRQIPNLMLQLTVVKNFKSVNKVDKKRNGNLFAATIRLSAAYDFIGIYSSGKKRERATKKKDSSEKENRA